MEQTETIDPTASAPRAARERFAWFARTRHFAGRIAARLGDLVLPPTCIGCQDRMMEHDTLCPACWRKIDFIRPPLCDRLGLPLPYDTGGVMVSAAAIAYPPNFERARAVALYNGLMRDLIHDLKYRDTHYGRRLLGRWLVEAGSDLIADCQVVVAVPLAPRRMLARRFNQSQLLANEVGRLSGKPVAPLALVRTRATRSQVGLSRSERERNVAGCFAVRAGHASAIAGKAVLLIDDVITTGATASAAARVLNRAGAARVDVLALALAGDTPVSS